MIKACIFDLDGTLTNTLDSLEYSVNETMKEIGRPQITKEQCRQFVGDGAKVLLERTLKAGGDTKLCHLEEAVEAYARIFDANCMYKVAPYEGIPQMLQQLKESGIKLAVLSNKPDRQAVHVVEEVFGKELSNHQLHTVAARCGYDLTNHHHALADAEACAQIALLIIPEPKKVKVDLHTGSLF